MQSSVNHRKFAAASGAPRTMIPMSWIGWALLSAVFAAATALLAKVGVAHVDSNLAMALRTSVVWCLPGASRWRWASTRGEIRALDRRTVLFLALSGLATGLSWLCYFRALQLGPASRVAPLDKLIVRWSWSSRGCCWARSSPPRPSSAACSSPPGPW